MAALVTLEQAKSHLRVPIEDNNADILIKTEQASAIILTYLKSQVVAGWTAVPPTVVVPGNVEAATLIVLEDLYERRPINWEAVGTLLVGLRDPALA